MSLMTGRKHICLDSLLDKDLLRTSVLKSWLDIRKPDQYQSNFESGRMTVAVNELLCLMTEVLAGK